MSVLNAVFLVAVIIFSAIVHEVMHGVAADKLGDPTARYAGRLTLNPISHIDPFGSILLPLVLVLTGAPIFFGYAKPVPYNPYNLRRGRFSEAIVAGAGPASNAVIAIVFGVLIRLGVAPSVNDFFFLIIAVNVMLCIFNLIPIPPLDGSKVLEPLLPRSMQYGYVRWRQGMERNPFIGMVMVVVIILLLGSTFGNVIYSIASVIAGGGL